MVGVAVRDDHKIDVPQVDSQRLHILLEDPGIVPGIEQDALAPILHQGCEAKIHGQRRRLAERVVQNGDAVWRFCGSHTTREQEKDNRQAS